MNILQRAFLFSILLMPFTSYCQTIAQGWAKSIGYGTGDWDEGRSIVYDAVGNMYVTGIFGGTIDFDPQTPAVSPLVSAGNFDISIAKYDPTGNLLWAKRIGGINLDQSNSMIIDQSGNLYLTGFFAGTVDFDPSNQTSNLIPTGTNSNAFIAKYNSSGQYIWAKYIGGTSITKGSCLARDTSGNIYLTGFFIGTTDFNPDAPTYNLTSSGSNDCFLAKYDSTGTMLWAKKMGGSSSDQALSLVVDNAGNAFVSGQFAGTADFDPSAATATLTSTGTADAFIARYNNSGDLTWAKNLGASSTSNNSGKSIGLDPSENIYVTGSFSGTSDFDPSTGTANLVSLGNTDIFIAKYDSTGNYIWANRIGSTGNDVGNFIKVDASGNYYITGVYGGTCDFDPSAATTNLTSTNNSLDIFVAKYNSSGLYIWASSMGGVGTYDYGNSIALDEENNTYAITGSFGLTADFDPSSGSAILNSVNTTNPGSLFISKYNSVNSSYITAFATADGNGGNDEAHDIIEDQQGNIYLTGTFIGTVDFDPSSSIYTLTSAGSTDIFIAKYDALGNFLWANRFGSTNQDEALSLGLDNSGNLIVSGTFLGTVDYDPSTSVFNLVSNGNRDIFLTKYNSTGNLLWAKSFGGASLDHVNDLITDNSGYIYMTGYFVGTSDFDPSPSVANIGSGTTTNYSFIAKYDSQGNYVWAGSLGGSNFAAGYDQGNSITLDSVNNIYVTGSFYGTSDFDPSANIVNLTSAGDIDLFFAKYDNAGNYVWSHNIGGLNKDHGYSVKLDRYANIYLTGSFTNTIDFDPSSTSSSMITGSYNTDIFIAKYTNSGNYIWAKSLNGTSGSDFGTSLLIDSAKLYLSAAFFGTVDFDPSPATNNLTGAGSSDIALAEYDTSGNYITAARIGGNGAEQVNSMIIDQSGSLLIAGYFSQTADFDPSGNINEKLSLGGNDIFYGQYTPCFLPIASITGTSSICQGTNATLSASGGTGYSWSDYGSNTIISGSNLADVMVSPTVTTTYTANVTNTCGTSVSTHVINVLNISTSDTTAATCNSFNWHGTIFYNSGSYTRTLTNSIGCDSIVTLYLSIIPSTSYSFSESECSSYTLNGQTYTTTGTYTQSLINAQGCDSVITLNLTINNSSSAILNETACGSYSLNNQSYFSSGTYTQTLTNSSGCDSIITLNLIVNNSTSSSLSVTSCGSYLFNNQTYTSSGIYTQVINNSTGCDSTITLNLTVNSTDTSITINGITLTANIASASYQWLDCLNGMTPISQETAQTFTAINNGEYAVEVNSNGCKDTSGCYMVIVNDITQNEANIINLYPNPTRNLLNVLWDPGYTFETITISNLLGKTMYKNSATGMNRLEIDLEKYTTGVYVLELNNGVTVQRIQFVKQ